MDIFWHYTLEVAFAFDGHDHIWEVTRPEQKTPKNSQSYIFSR